MNRPLIAVLLGLVAFWITVTIVIVALVTEAGAAHRSPQLADLPRPLGRMTTEPLATAAGQAAGTSVPDRYPDRSVAAASLSVAATAPSPSASPVAASEAATRAQASVNPARGPASMGGTIAGTATWYCAVGRSPCTRGYPAGSMYAAAGPALRVGNWRGSLVIVTSGGRSVAVRLIDACLCRGDRLLDLYAAAFERLAPLSRGTIPVTVGTIPAPPATSTAP